MAAFARLFEQIAAAGLTAVALFPCGLLALALVASVGVHATKGNRALCTLCGLVMLGSLGALVLMVAVVFTIPNPY